MDASKDFEPQPKKSNRLIVFGSDGNFDYFERCKIVCDISKRNLYVTPKGESEFNIINCYSFFLVGYMSKSILDVPVKSIVANFDQYFYQLKNIFCSFPFSSTAEFPQKGYVLIFKLEKDCKDIYENIQKRKNSNVVFCIDDEAEERFQNHFFLRIVNEIQKAEKFEVQLTEIIWNFLKSLSVEERKEYLNILNNSNSKLLASEKFAEFAKELETETNPAAAVSFAKNLLICDDSQMDVTASIETNATLPDAMDSTFYSYSNANNASKMDISMNDDDSNINETTNNGSFDNNDRRRSLRKRPLKKLDYSFDYGIVNSDDSNSNVHGENFDQEGQPVKKRAFKDIYSPNDTVEPPNYEVKEYLEFGVQRKKLIIFAFENKNLCRVYNYERSKNLFLCSKCFKDKFWVRADIIHDDENGNEYVRLGSNSHICEPIKYIPENYMDKEYIIIKPPNFKITQRIVENQVFPRLVIFNADNKNLCREYAWAALKNKFYCGRCKNGKNKKSKYICAKLIENENEETFVQLSPVKHICEEKECNFDENGELIITNNVSSRQKNVQVKEENAPKIIQSDGFKIKTFMKGENETKQLILFDEMDKTHNFIYHYNKVGDKFVCNGCKKCGKYISAKLYQNEENSEKYIKLGPIDHICKSTTLPFRDVVKPKKASKSYPEKDVKSIKSIKDATGKVIEEPNFIIEEYISNTEKQRKRLVIFNPVDKNYGYIYYFCKTKHNFVCNACVKLHRRVTANLHKNKENGKNFIELNHEHICEYRNIKELPKIHTNSENVSKENKILTKEKYKIETHLKNGVEWKRLYIDNPEDPNLPFKYYFDKKSNLFICGSCSWKKKSTLAKLRINEKTGEEYIYLFSTVHICQTKNLENSQTRPSTSQKEQQSKSKIVGKIVQSDGFKIETFTKGGNERKKLILFDENNKNFVYTYYYSYSQCVFVCNGCAKMNKRLWAKFHQNDVNYENSIELSLNEHVCQPLEYATLNNPKINGKILKEDDYKIVEYFKNGITKKRLLVYAPENRNLCYAYHYSNSKNKFFCNGCDALKKCVGARFYPNIENEGKSFIELSPAEHVCDPQPEEKIMANVSFDKNILTKEKFKIDLFNEDGIEQKRLIFADPNNSTISYTYFYSEYHNSYVCSECKIQRKHVSAKLRKNGDGEEFIELFGTNHVCTSTNSRKNDPNTPIRNKITGKIIEADGFKIEKFFKGGVHRKRLILFDENEKNLVYTYHFSKKQKIFICNGCAKLQKPVIAKLHFDSDNEENFIELGINEHICEPSHFQISWDEKNSIKILQNTDFKIEYFYDSQNIQRKRLIICESNDKTLCRVFSYNSPTKNFICTECQKMDKSITAKLKNNNEDGSEYLEVDDDEHICKPTEYIPLESSSKIFKSPYFKFEYYTENRMERKMLTVFDAQNKNHCYVYYFIPERNIFTCANCKGLGKTITAKLHQNDDGNDYIKLSELEHVCQPQLETRELDSSEFKLEMNDKNKVSKITVFQTQNKDFCYEFTFYKNNRYRCKGCFENEKKICEIKLFEDEIGNFYVKSGNLEHSCLPLNHLCYYH